MILLPKRRPLRVAALAGLVIAFVLVTTGVVAALFPARAAASSSSLEVLDGVVALSHDGQTFAMGRDGDLVQQGDVVRTGTASHAILTFYDGSTIEVEPDSELVVETLEATSSGDILMAMRQNLGRSWHVVSRALTADSKYEVRTPTATATVRGTAFLVNVEPSGRTNVQTTDGLVHAIAGGVEVEVPPGFETNIDTGGTPPDAPTPAPAPSAVVRIVIDATPNAIVVDPSGRAVGLINGLPVRYAPGSTIQLIDGKLVITIPNPGLGRIDTHVQPADPTKTSVDVNVQVSVGGTVVGNVVETRTIGSNGIAKGGVVITTAGTFIVPDEDANKTSDPRIGRLPPPPSAGLTLPFTPVKTAAPTPIVTPAPEFVPRFVFDPRLVAATTPTPAPPSPTPAAVFKGAFQPYAETTTIATSTATPVPNSRLTVFASAPPELTTLIAATPTPTPTLTTRLIAPILLTTPTPSPTAALILRTIDPFIPIVIATPTPAPTFFIIPRTLDPIVFATPTPIPPTDPPLLRTFVPILTPPIFIAPTPTPLFVPTFRVIIPTAVPTVAPTAAPTAPPIFQTLPPRIIQTIAPTPAPTLVPLPTKPINCRIVTC